MRVNELSVVIGAPSKVMNVCKSGECRANSIEDRTLTNGITKGNN